MTSVLLINGLKPLEFELLNTPLGKLAKLNKPCYMTKKIFKPLIPNYHRMCCDCYVFDTDETKIKIANKKPIRKENSLKEEELIAPTVK